MEDEAVQGGEELLRLNVEGAIDVARWGVAAYNSGHFDWNLLCGGDGQECVAERWRLVRWLGEEKLLDEPLKQIEDPDDREAAAAVMLCFLWINLGTIAKNVGVPPEDVIAGTA